MSEKTQEELQRIWDTCLLQYWRSAGNLMAIVEDFYKQTGKNFYECSLLRVPPTGYPWAIGVRVFMAERLEKISNRMWDMSPERDGALIDKLQTSKYDTANQRLNPDAELEQQRRRHRANMAKVTLESKNYKNRNKKTDWSTVK